MPDQQKILTTYNMVRHKQVLHIRSLCGWAVVAYGTTSTYESIVQSHRMCCVCFCTGLMGNRDQVESKPKGSIGIFFVFGLRCKPNFVWFSYAILFYTTPVLHASLI